MVVSAFFTWAILTRGMATVIHVPSGSPDWVSWLVFAALQAAILYLCWRTLHVKRVALVDDHLLVDTLMRKSLIPLERVLSIEWTGRTGQTEMPTAALVLSESTVFGSYIVFEPRSAEAFELLRSKIERSDTVAFGDGRDRPIAGRINEAESG
jgi:hypothetical protein